MTSASKAREAWKAVHWGAPELTPDEDLPTADPREKNFPSMGELVAIEYRTAKGTERLEVWRHEFKQPLPWLLFSAKDGRLLIAGGAYHIDERGIVG